MLHINGTRAGTQPTLSHAYFGTEFVNIDELVYVALV